MNGQFLFDLPLPAGWRLLSVDDIKASEKHSCVAGPFGSSISSKFFVEEGVPIIRGGNLRDDLTPFVAEGFVFVSPEQAQRYKGQHVRGGDLVFTCWGTLGQVGLIPRNGPFPEYIISNKQLKLRPNGEIADPRFLFYYFGSPQMVKHIRSIAIGAAVPGINLGLLKALQVALPPLSVQKEIVRFLSAYDDLIENNTRRINILEEMAQMIYREWFVHFRFPGYETVRMVESELGSIPEGWTHRSLDVLMGFQGGAQPPKSEWINEPRDGFVRMIQIRDYETDAHLGFVKDSRNLQKCREGDIMIARYGASVGRICRGLAGAYNVALVRVIPHQECYCEFLRSYLSSDTFQRLLIGMSGRTAQAGFNKEVLGAITLPIPSGAALFQRYETISRPMREIILCLRRTNKNLRTTRDFLLPKLISGEVSVDDADDAAVELVEQTA